MKYFLLALALFLQTIGYAQDKGPVEVTPVVKKKLKQEIEQQVPAFKKGLEAAQESKAAIEFAVDTFRIERLTGKWMDLDYSDYGMNSANYEAARLYDSLMNKYYKKLLAVLKGDDKKVLVQAQKAWLAFRDSETKLIGMLGKDEYSGGGTIQRLESSSAYLALIERRTLELFHHYERISNSD